MKRLAGEGSSNHITIIVSALLLLLPWAHAASPRTLVAKVYRVSDGDTITAVTGNQTKLRLRLMGIDAPEVPHGDKPGQPFGEEARDYLDHLIGGKTVRVDVYAPDEYKRVLAVIWDGPVNVNLLMMAMGYAEVYRGAPCQVYCQELEDAEAKTRRNRVGMWVQGVKYESPAAFRINEEPSRLAGRNAGRLPAAQSGTALGPAPWASPGRLTARHAGSAVRTIPWRIDLPTRLPRPV